MIGWLIVVALVLSVLMKDDGSALKAKRRREKQFSKGQRGLQRYESLPPMVRVINEEQRNRKILKRAKAAVSWAIVAEDFSQQEADGAILLALRRDNTLAQDSAKLHEAALSILKIATCQ
jgi:hypothetical protein